jgi:hypothetical protein
MMDWPVIGAVSAVVVVAGAVTFEVIVFMQPDPTPIKRLPQLASQESSVERSAYELPGFSTGRPSEWTPSFPLIRLIDPDSTPQDEGPKPTGDAAPQTAAKQRSPAASPSAKPGESGNQPSAPPREESKTAALVPPPVQPRAEQWRVVVTSKASYFNLGGHVDSAGIVDSLASSHLRDALKSHRNFPQLPPDIKTHILTQNINLNKLAPYRGLLGMNDKALEEEQAVRFERVASNR